MKKIIKDIGDFLVSSFSGVFYFIASLASLIGLLTVFIRDKDAVIVALIFFCTMLLIFTVGLLITLFKIANINNKEFDSQSTFVKYDTIDGKKITYEVYKLIQSTKPVMNNVPYNFKWSGTHLPKITSDLQKVTNVIDDQDPSKYDRAILRLNKPLYYNQSQVLHFKAELDDTDQKSDTFVSSRITREIDIIHYRIILKYKPHGYNVNAILERKAINSIRGNYEKILEISFDSHTKSYEYHLLKPDLNYVYRIRWIR